MPSEHNATDAQRKEADVGCGAVEFMKSADLVRDLFFWYWQVLTHFFNMESELPAAL